MPAKRTRSRSAAKKRMAIQDPMPTPPEPDMPGPSNGCSSCGHLPMSASSVVGVLAVAGLALSAVLLASSFVINPSSLSVHAFDLFGLVESLASR